jgi:hypothetical protein
MLYSYKSVAPVEPPVPAVIVALGLYPAQIVVPVVGVAAFKDALIVAELRFQILRVLQGVSEHPVAPPVLLP